jgi:hypothetical protein
MKYANLLFRKIVKVRVHLKKCDWIIDIKRILNYGRGETPGEEEWIDGCEVTYYVLNQSS